MGFSSKRSGRDSSSNEIAWLFVIVAIGILGWLWWHSALIPGSTPTAEISTNRPSLEKALVTNRTIEEVTPLPRTNTPSPVAPPVAPPPALPEGARMVQNILEAQVVLARAGISCGCIDGALGSQTRAALRAFQQKEQIPLSGELDAATKARLYLEAPPFTYLTITSNHLARLTPVPSSWLGKASKERLDYESILELAAERGEAHMGFVRSINPNVVWTNILPGTAIKIPNVERAAPGAKAALLKISLSAKTIQAFDSRSNLIAHAPCSIAQRVEKRPVGELHVAKIALRPNYVFNPEVFPESAEARQIKRKLVIPPGPNNPVGTAWIGLDKPGYGIHGTPKPEQVGRTESHGCFRLANWNADYFVRLVWAGLPVLVEP